VDITEQLTTITNSLKRNQRRSERELLIEGLLLDLI